MSGTIVPRQIDGEKLESLEMEICRDVFESLGNQIDDAILREIGAEHHLDGVKLGICYAATRIGVDLEV
jgi:hypothetical protein